MIHVLGTVVVYDHLAVGSSPQQLLAFPSGGQVCKGDLSLLQTASVKAIRTVEVDGTSDVVDVVGEEGPAVHHEEGVHYGVAGAPESGSQGVGVQGPHVLHGQSALQGGTLAARAGRQARGGCHLQLAPLGGGRSLGRWPGLAQRPVQRQSESLSWTAQHRHSVTT